MKVIQLDDLLQALPAETLRAIEDQSQDNAAEATALLLFTFGSQHPAARLLPYSPEQFNCFLCEMLEFTNESGVIDWQSIFAHSTELKVKAAR